MDAVKRGAVADGADVAPLMNELLVRQFHDILPGTCIHSVHEETRRAIADTIAKAHEMTDKLLPGDGAANEVTLINPLSFERSDVLYIDARGEGADGYASQTFTDLDGKRRMAIAGVNLSAFGSAKVRFTDKADSAASAFKLDGDCLDTPFACITFNETGAIASMIDKRTGRELVDGLPFNTFVMAEDVSAAWDNWDIDADSEDKFAPVGKLLSREVVSCGAVEMRIRSKWAISEKSTIEQDMVVSAASPMIAFDTVMDWHEGHRFLKAAFDTALHCDGVRSEIQFGHMRRSNHRSTDVEKARFEICNHKYSDLSENSYGIALINDCKYGLSVNEGSMRLSLHKGGLRPDREGDMGRHVCRYANTAALRGLQRAERNTVGV